MRGVDIDARAEIDQIAAPMILAGQEPTVEAIAQEMERRHTLVLPADLPNADWLTTASQGGCG